MIENASSYSFDFERGFGTPRILKRTCRSRMGSGMLLLVELGVLSTGEVHVLGVAAEIQLLPDYWRC